MRLALRAAAATSCLALALSVAPATLQGAQAQAQDREGVRTVESDHHTFQVVTVAQGLEHPWAIELLPDGRFLVTERNSGQLRLGSGEGELSGPIEGVPEIFRFEGDTPRSQGGLFDVRLHPDFDDNELVYLSFSEPTDRGASVTIIRGRLVDGDTPRLEDVETVFRMQEADQDSSGLHFGGRMAFHPDEGYLFLTIGDRRNISRAQDKEDQAGSVLRMMDDGAPPSDNPFIDEDEANEFVYSYGHRNPQGIGVSPDGELWLNDHGPEGGDEINLIEAGGNYGWPYLTAGKDYSGAPIGVGTEKEGMVSAVHSLEETAAPSGLVFYTGAAFSSWEGDMLNGAMYGEAIVRLRIGDDGGVEEEEWIELDRRIRDVAVDADGHVWVVTEHSDGEVLRLQPSGS